ncbi:MAG: lysophospholipase [Notoacmeibacter sp.]|nr:lysophospholipase [Notoacmeibacter sp.]
MKNSTTVRIIRLAAGAASRISPSLAGMVLERLFLTPRRLKLRETEKIWMGRARALPLRFDLERMFPAFFWGETGPLVVLVHGWSGRAGQLGAFVKPFVARGYRVVAFDAPAHGGADGVRTGLPEFAKALHVIERQFGPAHAIIAHSMGGAATLVALAEGLSAEKIALIAAPDKPGSYLPMLGQWFGFSPEATRRAQSRIEARFGYRLADLQGSALAPRVNLPALIVHDRRDREVGFADGEALASALPAAKMMETSGLGHNRILSDEAVVQTVVGFMAGEVREEAQSPAIKTAEALAQ